MGGRSRKSGKLRNTLDLRAARWSRNPAVRARNRLCTHLSAAFATGCEGHVALIGWRREGVRRLSTGGRERRARPWGESVWVMDQSAESSAAAGHGDGVSGHVGWEELRRKATNGLLHSTMGSAHAPGIRYTIETGSRTLPGHRSPKPERRQRFRARTPLRSAFRIRRCIDRSRTRRDISGS
jgi:hypothetical protein